MSSNDYWNNGQGQQHNQQQAYGNNNSYNQQQNFGGNPPYSQIQCDSGQSNPADLYGYLSNNKPTQQYSQHQDLNPTSNQQPTPSYNYNQGNDPTQYSGQHYQSYSHSNTNIQTQSYQEPYQQAHQTQTYGGHYPPQPPIYPHNHDQGPNPYPQQGYNLQPNPAQPPENERGLLGALGGAATGGFAGHKVNHGFMGTLGGAYAGHKLEDALKDKKKKKKKNDHGRRNSGSSSSSLSSPSSSADDEKKPHKKHGATAAVMAAGSGPGYALHQHQQPSHEILAGNFSSTCTSITLDHDFDLIASCATTTGSTKLSSINLNEHLTNEWGQLKWLRGGGFGGSARNVRLVDNGKVLEAELGDGNGGWKRGGVRLDERITNCDGELMFIG